ncbi:hypothetical protein FBQ97_12570, partial [Acidobacteria bacterium ACD]|nr:hypothetical protein [Acidobacteria bacterium ACD]
MTRRRLALLLALELASASAGLASDLTVWTLSGDRVAPGPGVSDRHPVGSLQKPWVVKAWAEAHPDPGTPPPRAVCRAGGGCWLATGHGELGLLRATAHSCNSWFLSLARDVPPGLLAAALRRAGFLVREPLDPWEAIGSGSRGRAVSVSPGTLLRAYRDLVKVPWPVRDELRRELLSGMALGAREGTGSGLGTADLLVKTGTVDAVDGAVSRTSGWALVADPSGERLFLALLPDGTGAGAAAALGASLGLAVGDPRPAGATGGARTGTHRRRPPPETVRVRLLASLRPSAITATNRGAAPVRAEAGGGERWVGSGGSVRLAAGTRLGASTWKLSVEPYGLVRVVSGAVEVGSGPGDTLTAVLASPLRDYVEGVLRGELRPASSRRAEELAAAVLRYLARGPRHGREDVCDLVHCARFAGLGPDVSWPAAERARTEGAAGGPAALLDAAWERARALAAEDGPWLWSSDCGGEPLSERAVWGRGETTVTPCPRHPAPRAESAWSRTW